MKKSEAVTEIYRVLDRSLGMNSWEMSSLAKDILEALEDKGFEPPYNEWDEE